MDGIRSQPAWRGLLWDRVRRITFVLFLADGRCALIPSGDRLILATGEVLAGEDPWSSPGCGCR